MARMMENLAILFADISGSTKLYNTLGDDRAQRLINQWMARMKSIVDAHSGRIIKTIGDEVMCVFRDAECAVKAAIDMQKQASAVSVPEWHVQIHIGVHYGQVITENNDVFGDIVNATAYLTAVATEEQILTTEAVEASVPPELRARIRPVFKANLKGSTQESTVYQVVWYDDASALTDVNMHSGGRVIPGDEGSMMVEFDGQAVRVDQEHPELVIGRGEKCGIVVEDQCASRQHATIRLMRTYFYLVDHSINGTFVRLDSGATIHVLRGELMIDTGVEISLGRSFDEEGLKVITMKRDRRAMYRVS